jgi:hypothetical protein
MKNLNPRAPSTWPLPPVFSLSHTKAAWGHEIKLYKLKEGDLLDAASIKYWNSWLLPWILSTFQSLARGLSFVVVGATYVTNDTSG